MPMRVTSADLMNIANRAERLKKTTEAVKHKMEKGLRQVVRTTELNAVAFGSSVLKGKMGEIVVMGVPLELGLGLGGHLLGFFGIGGSMNQHLHNIADGALVSWTVGRGIAIGHSMRSKTDQERIDKAAAEEKKRLSTTSVKGDDDGVAGTRLPASELVKAAQAS